MKKHYCICCLLCVLLFCLTSCKKSGCLESSGSVVTSLRPVHSFNSIALYDNINLILKQDSVESIVVEAGSNIQPFINTTIDNNTLTIRNSIDCKWLRDPSEKINVYASVQALRNIAYNSSGNITSVNTLKSDSITVNSNDGAGNVDLGLDCKFVNATINNEDADFIFHGKSDVCKSFIRSRGSIDFSNLIVKNMSIDYGGLRNANVNVTDSLYAAVFFKGNLYYRGNPYVTTLYYNTGRAIHLP